MLRKKQLFKALQWAIMVLAYGYLAYKLANIEYWKELKRSFEVMTAERWMLLASVILLMPVNWFLEAKKWQILTRDVVQLSLKNAVKAVLVGLNTGFVTPSRFGEFAGRIMFLPEGLRFTGTVLAFINGIIQTLVITLFGFISAYFYSLQFNTGIDYSIYLFSAGIILALCIAVYCFLPSFFERTKEKPWVVKFRKTVKSLSELNMKTLISAFLLSTIRFAIFCFQYYLLLFFFGIALTPIQALIGIPTVYLLISYTPTLAASEAAVRVSAAVLILRVFSDNEIGIILTGILIWLINFVAPMICGSTFLMKSKSHEA